MRRFVKWCSWHNYNFKPNDLLQFILVPWHYRKHDTLSGAIFVTWKPSTLSSRLNEYCHLIIVSILTKGWLKRTQGMTHKDLLEPKKLDLHFERRNSQHKNIPINKPLKNLPTELLRFFFYRHIFSILTRGFLKRTQRMTHKGPTATKKQLNLYQICKRSTIHMSSRTLSTYI